MRTVLRPSWRQLLLTSRLQVSPAVYLYLALVLLTVPIKWACAFVLSAVLHELGHLGIIRLLRIPVQCVSVAPTGAVIATGPMSSAEECICALAGPAAGLAAACLFRGFPELVICALIHSMINLLPLYPLDGGRVLYSLLCCVCPADTAQRIVDAAAWILLGALAVCLVRLRAGLLTLVLPLWVLRGIMNRKNSLQR